MTNKKSKNNDEIIDDFIVADSMEDKLKEAEINPILIIAIVIGLLILANKNPTYGLMAFIILWAITFIKLSYLVLNKN